VIGKIINILGVIVAVVVIGSIALLLVVSTVKFVVASTVLLWVVGSIVALLILAWIWALFDGKKREDALREHDKMIQTHGYYAARELCSHKRIQLTQQDFGVITFTTKWCKVCGKNLGPR
jgi:hypothetical protein